MKTYSTSRSSLGLYSLGTIVALHVAPQLALADLISRDNLSSDQPCSELIKECFAYSGAERNECFYTSSQHQFCEGSELGALAFKRWAMSSSSLGGRDVPPSLLGPQLADQKCVENFDSRWSSLLLDDMSSYGDLAGLSYALEQCRENERFDILRP